MNHEPPVGPPPGADSAHPADFVVDEATLAAYSLVEEAGLLSEVSLELWEHLPEDFCRDHELDRGRLIRRESGSPGHQSASLSIAIVLKEAARRAVEAEAYPCLRVSQDLDVRLWDVPCATVRKPDVLVYRCLEKGVRKLWASGVVLAVEIVSPSSVLTDTGRDNVRTGFESKMSQYAAAGIKHYWVARLRPDDSAIASIQRFRLDESAGVYFEVAFSWNDEGAGAISTEAPFALEASWADLDF